MRYSLLLSFLLLACQPPAPTPDGSDVLDRSAFFERRLEPGERHRFTVDLAPEEHLDVAVEQDGVDLALEVTTPDETRLRVDGPYAERGTERALVESADGGTFTVEVLAPEKSGGTYRLRSEVRHTSVDDRPLLDAARYMGDGDRTRRAGDLDAADVAYALAAESFARTGDAAGESLALHRRGQVRKRRDEDDPAARAAYRDALELARAADLRPQAADLAFGLGRLYVSDAEFDIARASFDEAEALFAGLDDLRRQAQTVNETARVLELSGRLDDARRAYTRAAELIRRQGDPRWQGTFLNNLGQVHMRLGQPGVAHGLFEEALALRRRAGDLRGEGITLTSRGNAERRLGRLDDARGSFAASWRRLYLVSDGPKMANALVGMGLAELQLGHPGVAERAFRSALFLVGQAGHRRAGGASRHDRRAEALVLLNLAEVEFARGDGPESGERARQLAEQARALFDEVGDRQGQASAFFALARAERRRGRLEDAWHLHGLAVERMESIYEEARLDPLRMSYLAFRREYYEHAVDVAVALHRRDPDAGWTSRAVALSERGRARSLLATVVAARSGAPPPAPEPFDAGAFVERYLDDGTAVLEISLGDDKGHLFWIDRGGVQVFPLPGRDRLDPLARVAHEALQDSHKPLAAARAKRALRRLSELVLGPVAGLLGDRRLVVLPEGALHYVPFAALPDPRRLDDEEPPPLVERHEVVSLPSASVLAALRRRELADGSRDRKTLAVVADPVFEGDDERLDVPVQGADDGGVPLTRLLSAAAEATAILALVPEEDRFAALDFDANVDLVQSGVLAGYRILHVATHGRLNAQRPELSGLELARYTSDGRRRRGTLYAHEVYDLRLDADLVVLSACRTALGREVRGEGLVGLTQGFFHAGASRVLVSLWSVDDEATRELMVRFYGHLLREGKPPPAALRAAQRELRAQERWRSPYYWAAFVVQGDWR